MLIEKLFLTNFRNYTGTEIYFFPGINLLAGPNGQGKTNLLEAIYYLLTGKSYRAQREQELVRWGEAGFYIDGNFRVAGRPVHLESQYRDRRKTVKVNGLSCRRLSEYVGHVNAVYFSPDDLVMLKGGPLERRRFIDLHIAQMRPGYVALLNTYNKILQQKRALLKTSLPREAKYPYLSLWNEQLIEYGRKVIENRYQFVASLQEQCAGIYADLTAHQEKLTINYLTLGTTDLVQAIFLLPRLLTEKLQEEIIREAVLVGPHRDDLQIFLNDKSARLYASQGQQRSIVLALKLAELSIIRQEKGEHPLLLLDDVLSELDRSRRNYLMEFIRSAEIQTLLTMTSADEVDTQVSAQFRIRHGQIRRE